ncbi:MAG TPA: UpxY family transcription antiterminator [Candidatus Acidoferrales bacterium]
MACLQTKPTVSQDVLEASGELFWFAVQTRPRHEKKVATELKEKGIGSLVPLRAHKRQWSDRERTVEFPLFPQYVFVRIAQNLDTRVAVLRTNGITSFVGTRGIGIPIPEEQIERIQRVSTAAVPVTEHPFLNVGERVRIRGGALDGLQGILTAVNGDQNLVVSVDLIQRSVAIRLAGFAIERA